MKTSTLKGRVVGRLTVIEFIEERVSKSGKTKTDYWRCRCECGNEKVVSEIHLYTSKIRSCGCLKTEILINRSTKHGFAAGQQGSLYRIWKSLRGRCMNPRNRAYPYYGGRGISVCERWNDFSAFMDDMGPTYWDGASIDRFPNNDGNYEPSNCRWATRQEQANNKRNNRIITCRGESQTLAEWSRKTGLSQDVIERRLNQCGWSEEDAVSTPLMRQGKK